MDNPCTAGNFYGGSQTKPKRKPPTTAVYRQMIIMKLTNINQAHFKECDLLHLWTEDMLGIMS